MSAIENQTKNLRTYIEKIATKILENKVVSNVITGTISSIEGQSYVIKLSGSNTEINAIPIDKKQIYKVNDYVYMISFIDGTDTVYRIYDTVDKTYEEFYNLTTDERFSDEDGKLFFDNFASSPSALNYVLGQDTENEGKYIDKIKESGCFKIEGCFGSSENTSQDFGLKILFYEEDAVSAFKTEYLNPPYFLGQPHNLSQAVSQSKVITLSETDKQKLNYIVIQTFGEGFVYSNVKLTCGILLNVESLFTTTLTIENNKNYFSPDEYQDSISLKAEVSQDGRKLTSDSLSYYWLLKDNNFNDKDSSQYLDIAGDGWRCINTFSIENKVAPDGSGFIPTKIWHKSESKLVLNEFQIDKGIAETSGFLFSNFSNELKCLVTYKDVKVSSRTVTINNYYKEQFFAELYASVNPATIINSEDSFTLTCEVKNENNKINLNNYEYKYTWYKKSDSENIDITPKDSNGDIINNISILTIIGVEDAVAADKKVYKIQDSHETIFCEVTISSKDKNENGDFIFISKEISNEQEISSVLKDSSIDITSTKEFKYYISENNMSVSFDQAVEGQEEGSSSIWNGDWEIYDKELKNHEWTDLIVGNEQEAYLKIFGEDYTIFTDAMKQSENIYYVYYTERTLWEQDVNGLISTIRTENWQQPTLARAVVYKGNSIWENLKTGQAIEQINTFNQLTNYGKEEGIFYADELYIVTNDEIKDDSKTYYIKQNNEYVKFMGTSFINNITYYEKVSTTTGKKLYINANYINTGALRVGSENNEKFYADIDNDNVKIAGFVVDKNSLSSGQDDTDEYVYLGTDGLKVGNFLQAGPNGAAISGSVTFTGENGASSTFNELQQQIIIYGERKNLVVYSLSETKPKIKPYLSKDGDTNIGEFASENTTWFTSYDASKVIWMCQKYDNSLVDNNEIPWGDIIQIAAAKSYSIEIDNDFIAIPTAAGGELDSNWNEIINVSIKKGFETYSLPNNIGPGAPIGDEEKLGYEVSNVTVTYIPEDKNFKITNLTKDTGKIWFKFYKFGQLQATATVELVKQKSGSSGGVPTIGQDGYWYIDGNKTDVLAKGQDGSDGETPEIKNGYWYIGDVSLGVKAEGVDGEYSYIQTDIGSIKKDVDSGNLLTQSIVINAYKKIGSQPPVSDTKKYYVGVKIDEKQAITWLESLVLLKDYTYTIPEVPTKKLTLYFNPDSKNSGVDYGLIDKIVLNVIQDGQDGQSGRSVGNIEEYYRISNEDNSDNTYEYSTSVPAFTAQDLEKGRICIWNYEITLDAEGEEISQTNAVLLFKYAFDGTDGLNGKDGTDGLNGKDGISIQSITEYYKLYAEAQDFAEAPSIEELDEEWTDSADSLTSGDKPFKYNCEVITFDRDRDPIITMPQLVAEHPKTVHFIYSSSSTKPETPNPGIPAEGWTTTLESDTKWKCEKVDYNIYGSVAWSEPYQIVATDGTSPYLLSIDNDFIAIPCDSEGQLIDKDFSEIFNVSIYQGDKIYNLTNNEKIKVSFINGFSVDITEGNNYKYTLTNFVFEEEKDRGTILVELIRDESIILASSTIEIIKQKQGNKGSTGDTGEAGSYVYALANTNTISVNENGKLKSADRIETISIGVYKRSGGNAPSFDKDNYYAVSFKNNQGNEHLYRGRKANSENAFTCKIGDKNSNNGVQLQTPTLNLTISIYQVSAYNESLMNNPNAILIDRIVLNVVKDGATGSQGTAGRNPLQSVFYYTWSTNKNDSTTIDISGLYPLSSSYFHWGVDDNNKKTIKFFTPMSWIKSDGYIVDQYWNWALEKDFFKHWSGTECSVRYITADSNLGNSTFVWKIQVTAYDDGTIGIWESPVLVPELEAIELAAKYQIKDNIYVNGFFNNDNLTYPLLGDTSDGNEYDAEKSITGLTALTPFIKVPEGDIGRWCRLYERTVISGGAILTGSITADKIKVNDLSALQANIGGWTISQDALISSNKWIQLISNNTLPYQDDYACIIAGKKWLISSPEEIKVYYIIGEDDSLTDIITHDSAYFNSDKGDTIVEFSYNDQGQAVLYKNDNNAYPGLVDYEDEYVYQGIVTMNNRQYNSWKIVAENHECRGWGILTNVIIDNTFVLTQSGELYASKANISGTIYATLGTIGLFEITTDGELHAYTKNNDDDAVDTTLQNGRLDIGDVTIIGSDFLFKYGDNENSNWLNSGIYTPRVYLESVTDTPSGLGMHGLAISDSFYIANAVYDDIVRSDMFTSKKSYFYFDSISGQVWLHPKTNLILSDSYWGDRRFIFNALRIQFTTEDNEEAQIETAFMSAGAGATVAGSGGYIIITPKQTFPSTPIVVVNQCGLNAGELTGNKLTIGHIINTQNVDEKEKIQISTSGRKANTTYYLEVFIYCS